MPFTLRLALALACPLAALAQIPRLSVERINASHIQLRWPAEAGAVQLEQAAPLVVSPVWLPVNEPVLTAGDERVVELPLGDLPRFFRLRAGQVLTTVADSSPAEGEGGVSVTRETIVRFTAPLAPTALLGPDAFFAERGGVKVLGRIELSGDRHTATLFYLEPLPASSQVTVHLDGGSLRDEAGNLVDVDGDGAGGGTRTIVFRTMNAAPVGNTAVIGRVFASELKPGPGEFTSVNVPLEGVIITVDGAEETLRTTTDAQGNFRLQPAPSGRFFVHVDGRTAVGSDWPGGTY